MGGADEGGDALRLGGDVVQRLGGRAQEAGAQEQVLRRVPGHRELGKEDEVRARVARLLEAGEDPLAVTVEVADDAVHLREREAHRCTV